VCPNAENRKIIELTQKIPVFIVYMPVTIEGDKVIFLKDIYGLIK
jgi:murein L,D-transpeptidase YcbB/YkuD